MVTSVLHGSGQIAHASTVEAKVMSGVAVAGAVFDTIRGFGRHDG
jgi:hypothetical protein